MNRHENTVPKNYEALPAGPARPGPGLNQVSHERLRDGRVHATLTLRLVARDPVRVGTGGLVPVNDKGDLALDLVVRNGAPLLPGSSLKGVLRTAVEALGGGCDLQQPCNPPCVACQLFGFVHGQQGHYAGRVSVEDAVALKPREVRIQAQKLPRAFQPRVKVGRRVYGPAVPGAPVSVLSLVAAVETTWETRLHLANLTPAEAGLVLLGFGLDGSFHPRVGGGKYHGLGRVQVSAVKARLRRDGYRAAPVVLEGDALKTELTAWLGAVRLQEPGQRALATLRRTMGAP